MYNKALWSQSKEEFLKQDIMNIIIKKTDKIEY